MIWSSFEYQAVNAEHGTHRSPLLCAGKLFVGTGEKLIAYDAATGKELWRTPAAVYKNQTERPIETRFNNQPALQTRDYLVNLNGEILAKGGYSVWECYLPVVEDGILYNSSNRRSEYSFEAIAIPKQVGDKHNLLWKLEAKTLYGPQGNMFGGYYVASPLYVDGLIYQVDSTGNLVVIDTKERKRCYQLWMDGYNVNDYRLYGYCASPTLAGKNIYLMDTVGYVSLLKPGADGTVTGTNILQNITSLPASAPCKQEVFYAGMYFEGKRMFIHGDEYLYCIEEK